MRWIPRLATLVAALALAAAATGATATFTTDRGVVQSATPTRIVLRELDGSVAALAVDGATRVRLNGLPATLDDIRPGFVAAVTHDGGAAAVVVRAFGRVRPLVDRGTVVSVLARRLTIRSAAGISLVFRISARTRVRWRGLPATVAAIRAGRFAVVAHTPAGEALRIAVRAHPLA